MKELEPLGIVQLENIDEIFALSDPVVEPALRAQDAELARSAFRAVARILQRNGYITPLLAENFIEAAEQRTANLP
ncbi:MAG: hypothetical protein ABWX90_00070 [Candidatus Saccharimonadales bacterium]